MKQNRMKRLWAILLICALLLGLSVPVLATAGGGDSTKEEVVYINLNSDGSVDAIYVVNTFALNEANQIVDYGDYTALRNMTTNDELIFEDQTVRIDTEEKLLYYEGQLSNTVIPWQFHIGYELDGQTVTADELAGADGFLGLTRDVEKNPVCTSSFFE